MELKEWQDTLAGWDRGLGPRYLRLATHLRGSIQSGRILRGARLPPERSLAQALGISRTTAVAAYEVLRSEGAIESRQGSGTFVRQVGDEPPASRQEHRLVGAFRRNTVFRGLLEEPGLAVEFLGAHLDAPAPLLEEVQGFLREDAAATVATHGYIPGGLRALRRAVAAHLTRSGLASHEDEVLVTNGAQQAIGLAAALFVESGDAVAIEDPTYLGAIDLFGSVGARLIPVPVTSSGLEVGRLRDAMAMARLVYLVPSYHNPTGTVLPERERREIARWVADTQIPLVEDLALADLRLGDDPPPPIAAFAPKAPILTLGSMSKLFWGGLRVGWVRGPVPLIERLSRLKALADLGGPVLSQAVAARLLPRADETMRLRRKEVRRKLARLTALLTHSLPGWSWRLPEGGLLLWVRLPHGSASDFARVAQGHGVALVPGPVNSPSESFDDYVRLPFVHDDDVMTRGVARLAQAWGDYEARAREPRPTLGVIV